MSSKHYVVPAHVYVQEVLDEMVLMDTRGGEYFELNAAAADIVRRLRAHGELDRLVAELEAEYAPAPESLRGDVEALLDELTERGLLTGAES